jgi:hypothetical protein
MHSVIVHLLSRCANRMVHSGCRFGCAVAILGCASVSIVGCARTEYALPPFAWSGYRADAVYPSKKHTHHYERLGPTRIVTASWYGPGYVGKRTASGERFDPNRRTAASNELPLDSTARVTNLRNGRSVSVKVNDRGPASKRGIDLSPAAARQIGLTKTGVARVKVTPVSE